MEIDFEKDFFEKEISDAGAEMLSQYTQWYANMAELSNDDILYIMHTVEITLKILMQDIIINR